MKVTKAQAEANRALIVETASSLFREHGFDGVGIADLMAAAGLTHGGFYNHFASKTDLIAKAAQHGLDSSAAKSNTFDLQIFVKSYVTRKHRDSAGDGCTLAALGCDAARQPDAVKATFENGIESILKRVEREAGQHNAAGRGQARAQAIDVLAQAVGAVILSRACPDQSRLADEILKVCRAKSVERLG